MSSLNLITYVAGIMVGHADDRDVISGVTAILCERPNIASAITRGGAPGTRDTALLDPEMTVQGVDGIVLSGGSVYGLDAAGGVLCHLRQKNIGLDVAAVRVPIVPQAITFDLLNGGKKDWGRTPLYWNMGYAAAKAAEGGRFQLGTAGGGYGATTANYKGGIGSASMRTAAGHTVGAIVVVNAIGSATIGDGPAFWAGPVEIDGEYGGVPFPPALSDKDRTMRMKGASPPSTTIAIVATDASLTKQEARRMAQMADDGLARAIRPAHAPMDGDTVFAVATQRRPLDRTGTALTELGLSAADCLARAIARGIFEATLPASPAYVGPPAYQQVHSS